MRRGKVNGIAAIKRRGPSNEKLLAKTKGEVHAIPPELRRRSSSTVALGMPTTEQQKQLAAEYLKDFDFMAAARRAGYTGSEQSVMRVFRSIATYIREAHLAKARAVGRRVATSQSRVLSELAAEAHYSEMDFTVIEEQADPEKPGQMKTVRRQKRLEELTDYQCMLVHNIKFHADGSATYSLPNRNDARKLIGRHLGMFTDKLIIANLGRAELGDKDDLSKVPDDELAAIEKRLVKYLGPNARRALGEWNGEEDSDQDSTTGRVQ